MVPPFVPAGDRLTGDNLAVCTNFRPRRAATATRPALFGAPNVRHRPANDNWFRLAGPGGVNRPDPLW